MIQRTARAAISLAGIAITLLATGPASGQEKSSGQSGSLQLRSRRIDVFVHENVATLKYSFSVFNPYDRMMEGEVTFETPEAAVGCELTLLRNIASTDRAAKIMDPLEAAAIYEAVMKKDLTMDTPSALAFVTFGPNLVPRIGGVPVAGQPAASPSPSPAGAAVGARPDPGLGGDLGTGPRPRTPLANGGATAGATGTGTRVMQPPVGRSLGNGDTMSGTAGSMRTPIIQAGDPALLEQVSAGVHKLRFFPVPALCDETVTATFAMEIRCGSEGYSLSVPFGMKSEFTRKADTIECLSLAMTSRGMFPTMTSRTHKIHPIWLDYNSMKDSVAIDGKAAAFQMTYSLDRKAKPFDFTKVIAASEIVPVDGLTWVSGDRAVQAVRVRRFVESLLAEADGQMARVFELSQKAKIISKAAALIVIERWQINDAKRDLQQGR